ncbi:NXPE family member 1-like [Discoglossus pictus]
MAQASIINFRMILGLSFFCILVMSIMFHHKFVLPLNFQHLCIKYSEQSFEPIDQRENINTSGASDIEQKITQILNRINQSIPNITFIHMDSTTSALKSRAIILDHRQEYCVGDSLIVQVIMFDYLGNMKTYGGDFLRARIYSSYLKAGASGSIEDFGNGTYHVHFTLFWEGNVKISILLYHSSEGVSALWRARNKGYKNVIFTGKFLNKTKEIHMQCGFELDSHEEKCEYAEKRHGELFYCIKPQGVPCGALISMKTDNAPYKYLSNLEKELFKRSNIAIEIPKNMESLHVVSCNKTHLYALANCTIGMLPPFPSGYFLNNFWNPLFCNLSSFGPLSQIDTCLSGKSVYLMGDSTSRQWLEFFAKVMKNLKFFDLHGSGWHKVFMALDMERNIYMQWKKHGHPFLTVNFYNVKDHAYVTQEIDSLGGNPYTVIIIALGQHFRPFPLVVYIRRLLNVRKAIERLFQRSPDTKVIIKLENTREINTDVERCSDFHGYVQYLLTKDVFQGLSVGIIDAWDMTIAFGSYDLHPPETVISNQINMFLAYICNL